MPPVDSFEYKCSVCSRIVLAKLDHIDHLYPYISGSKLGLFVCGHVLCKNCTDTTDTSQAIKNEIAKHNGDQQFQVYENIRALIVDQNLLSIREEFCPICRLKLVSEYDLMRFLVAKAGFLNRIGVVKYILKQYPEYKAFLADIDRLATK